MVEPVRDAGSLVVEGKMRSGDLFEGQGTKPVWIEKTQAFVLDVAKDTTTELIRGLPSTAHLVVDKLLTRTPMDQKLSDKVTLAELVLRPDGQLHISVIPMHIGPYFAKWFADEKAGGAKLKQEIEALINRTDWSFRLKKQMLLVVKPPTPDLSLPTDTPAGPKNRANPEVTIVWKAEIPAMDKFICEVRGIIGDARVRELEMAGLMLSSNVQHATLYLYNTKVGVPISTEAQWAQLVLGVVPRNALSEY